MAAYTVLHVFVWMVSFMHVYKLIISDIACYTNFLIGRKEGTFPPSPRDTLVWYSRIGIVLASPDLLAPSVDHRTRCLEQVV